MKQTFFLLTLVAICTADVAFGQFRKRHVPQTRAFSEQMLNYANPTEYIIGGIEIRGLDVLDENAIISLTGLRVGDKIKIPGEHIAGAIRKLWRHGLIGNIAVVIDKVEGQNIFLSFVLSERPRLIDFYFTGIESSQQSSLRDDLSLIRGKIVNDAVIKNTELVVKRFFVDKGFLNTEVKIVQEEDTLTKGGVRIRIDVDKKARVRINRIVLIGNQQLHDAKLKSKMKKTKEYARFSLLRSIVGSIPNIFKKNCKPEDSTTLGGWARTKAFITQHVKLNLFAKSKLVRTDFEEDKKNLIKYYNTKGYRDAVILHDTVQRHSDNSIDVQIALYEGRKYYFRNITWVGNHVHSIATLSAILDISKGTVYNKELIDRKTMFNPKGADIVSLYMDDGYLFFKIIPTEIAVEGDSIDIEMRIFEGEQATIRNVAIEGNDRTNDHVIRRELSTIPGQKFRRSDVIRTQQQLSQLRFFNPQTINPDIRPNPAEGTVDINWQLEEQSNDQIQLSGGWGGPFGFVGTVGVTFNNFSLRNIPHFDKWRPLPVGDGQRLSLSVQANGLAYQNYSCSFTEPWLGGRKPNSFTVSFNYSVVRRVLNNRTFDDRVSLQQSGLTIGLGKRLEWPDNYFTLVNSLSLRIYTYKGNYFRSAVIPSKGQTNDIKLKTTLSRNSIDNPTYPTRGSTISLSLSLTPPYSLIAPNYFDKNRQFEWVEMHKWMIDTKFYLKLIGSSKPKGRSLVLETKAHFGFIGRYNDALLQSPFDRFLLGGDGLAGGFNSFVLGQDVIGLRGYTNNSITPPLYALRSSLQSKTVEGGVAYSKVGMELRYPITVGQTATIYALLFVEGGNNWDNFEKFNPFQLYKSAGVGLKIFMPAFGLIGLNWGYGFDKIPGSRDISGSQFHFTFGQQIR